MLKFALVPLAAVPALLLISGVRDIERMDTFLGRFHPVLLHLPIGVLLLVMLLEIARATGRAKWQFPTTFPLFFGAISAVTAMTLGILLMEGEAMEGALVVSHFRWGIATAVMSLICLTLHQLPRANDPGRARKTYRSSLAALALIMGFASHQGASITHGESYLTEYFPWKSAESDDATKERIALLQQPHDSREIYPHLIAPILESKCYDCHRSRSFKGGLIMDTYAGLMQGGETGPSIVPFAPNESLSLQRIHLPLADEEHMPPANEPQMSAEEINVLEWWIEAGAPAAGTVASTARFEDLQNEIEIVTAALIAEEGLSAEELVHHHLNAEEVANLRAPVAESMAVLQKRFPGMVRYLNNQTDRISVVSYHHTWSDADLQALSPIAGNVVELLLPGHRLGEKSAALVASMRNLEKLDLRSGHLENTFIADLNLPALRILNLFATDITPASLSGLSRLTGLKELYLGGNGFTADDIAPLQTALPGCAIYYETASFKSPE